MFPAIALAAVLSAPPGAAGDPSLRQTRLDIARLNALAEHIEKGALPTALARELKKLADKGATPDIRREASFHLAGLYRKHKNAGEAAKVYDGLSRSVAGPWGLRAAVALGDMRRETDELDAAVEAYERILRKNILEPEAVRAALGVGLILEKRGDREGARKSLHYGRSVAKRLYEDDRKSIADALKAIDAALRRLRPNRKPASPEAAKLLAWGNAELARKRYGRALGHYDKVLKDFPEAKEADEAGHKRGLALYLRGKPAEARQAWEEFVQGKPDGPWRGHARVGLGDIALECDFDALRAEKEYQTVTGSDATDPTWNAALPDARLGLGICLYLRRDFAGATRHFEEELRLRPHRKFGPGEIPSPTASLVRICRRREYPVRFPEYVMRGNRRVQTLLFLACCNAECGRNEKALSLIRRLLGGEITGAEKVHLAYARYEEAELLRLLWRFDESLAAFKTFVRDHAGTPMGPQAMLELAALHFSRTQNAEALKVYQELWTQHPGRPEAAKALYFYGYYKYVVEDWAEALRAFKTLVSRHPKSWEAKRVRKVEIPYVSYKRDQSRSGKEGCK